MMWASFRTARGVTVKISNHPRWRTNRQGIRREIFRHHRVGADHTVVPDRDALADRDLCSQPNIVPDSNRSAREALLAIRDIECAKPMIVIANRDEFREHTVRSNLDSLPRGNRAVMSKYRPRSDGENAIAFDREI